MQLFFKIDVPGLKIYSSCKFDQQPTLNEVKVKIFDIFLRWIKLNKDNFTNLPNEINLKDNLNVVVDDNSVLVGNVVYDVLIPSKITSQSTISSQMLSLKSNLNSYGDACVTSAKAFAKIEREVSSDFSPEQ